MAPLLARRRKYFISRAISRLVPFVWGIVLMFSIPRLMISTTKSFYYSNPSPKTNQSSKTNARNRRPLPSAWIEQVSPSELMAKNAIPPIMIFTHKTNLLIEQADAKDLKYFSNIVQTIQMYAKAWQQQEQYHPEPRVWFLDNRECLEAIAMVEPALLEYYQTEENGSYKGDICRGAALYLTGGYYFDVDMQAIAPLVIAGDENNSNNTSKFVTVSSYTVFFNSFMASSRQHAILENYLQILLYYYQEKNCEALQNTARLGRLPRKSKNRRVDPVERCPTRHVKQFYYRMPLAQEAIQNMISNGLPGPWALKAAVRHYQQERRQLQLQLQLPLPNPDDIPVSNEGDMDMDDGIFLLTEQDMGNKDVLKQWYPHLPYQEGGTGGCCNYIVHDATRRQPYFFSRFLGASSICDYANKSQTMTHVIPDWPERLAQLEALRVQMIHLPMPTPWPK